MLFRSYDLDPAELGKVAAEDGTGLDFENILFNTMDILGTD